MFYPSLHLLAFVCDYLSTRGFEGGGVLHWVGPSAFLMPSYIPLMFPVMAAVCISWLRCVQYSFAHRIASEDLAVFLPKVARAVLCIVYRRISHFSVTETLDCGASNSFSKASANCEMRFGCDILLTSIRGFPCFLILVYIWPTSSEPGLAPSLARCQARISACLHYTGTATVACQAPRQLGTQHGCPKSAPGRACSDKISSIPTVSHNYDDQLL